MPISAKGEQLKMFMTPGEIKSAVTTSPDLEDGENMSQMWQRKGEENYMSEGSSPSLMNTIKREGFNQATDRHSWFPKGVEKRYGGDEHVGVVQGKDGESWLNDGHHRVEALSKTNPNQFINVDHYSREGETSGWVNDHYDKTMKEHQQYPRPTELWHKL